MRRSGSNFTSVLQFVHAMGVRPARYWFTNRSEEHTSELQSQSNLVCRLLLEKKKKNSRHKHSLLVNCQYLSDFETIFPTSTKAVPPYCNLIRDTSTL